MSSDLMMCSTGVAVEVEEEFCLSLRLSDAGAVSSADESDDDDDDEEEDDDDDEEEDVE